MNHCKERLKNGKGLLHSLTKNTTVVGLILAFAILVMHY